MHSSKAPVLYPSTPSRCAAQSSRRSKALASGSNSNTIARDTSPLFDRFSRSSLGSPFLTTTEDHSESPDDLDLVDGSLSAVPRRCTITRPPSVDFSIINVPIRHEEEDCYTPISVFGTPIGLRRPIYGSTYNLLSTSPERNVLKSLFPRLWDAFSSPVKNASVGRARSRSFSGKGKGKERDCSYAYEWDSDTGTINYVDLPPLDGEEGELVDDEACFIDVTAVTGIDIISLLPAETSLHILSTFLDLPAIISCLGVSKTWRRLASDTAVWHALFQQNARIGWGVDLTRWRGPRNGTRHGAHHRDATYLSLVLDEWNRRVFDDIEAPSFRRAYATSPRIRQRSPTYDLEPATVVQRSHSLSAIDYLRNRPAAPLTLDWRILYEYRHELDKRWGTVTQVERGKKLWDPTSMRISGHGDSVYCLEFDSTKIVTGSRDKTIKVWSLSTGERLGSFKGHNGSVLCLKFDQDWDSRDVTAPGFMVSGSSDCTVCVWEVYREGPGGVISGHVKKVLKGHKGGVLDIRMDDKWIVSCSKDTSIRVWDRQTLRHHRTLNGHEGPVNAVGLLNGRIVSASGDGKMILWDVESGKSLRTFEGHDRGLACVDFKNDLIISGSSDCKIKVWSVSTGECLKTLSGHDDLVRALSFDPLSGRLVSASYDKTIKVWDIKSGKMIRDFGAVHSSHIFDVKFDVTKIISASRDKKLVVLDFSVGMDASLFV